MSALKETRIEKGFTQPQAAELVGISLRSYKSYENDKSKIGTIKYNYILEQLAKINPIDEEHGILTQDSIIKKSAVIFQKYNVDYCYLFGSYAKGKAKPDSDVDLLISSNVKGLQFFALVEDLRNALHKKVDALDIKQLNNNPDLINEILKDGTKIYG